MITDETHIKRDKWKNKIDFLLACIGFSVGLGNVWRFPYLCYKNGGGAFLLPYFISVFLGGIPVFFLEVALGQLMSRGGIEAWEICPLLKGIGYAGTVIVFSLNCYYNVILAWALHYLFSSFTSELPWTSCNNEWNTDRCVTSNSYNHTAFDNNSSTELNTTTNSRAVNLLASETGLGRNVNSSLKAIDPATEYWEKRVLRLSDGIEHIGTINWDLSLCLLLAWIIVFLCICKGIKTSGKVMYITATSPYVLMLILLIRTVTLDGAADGLNFYLKPDWTKLTDMTVWSDAGTQIFFSYSLSLGTLTALGSYNGFYHNSFRDCLIFAGVNSFTSLLAGCIIFATLGYMSFVTGISIADVAESGPGLAFVVYPKALGTMPISPLWSCLFFTMILLLGLDSQFVGVEGLVTAITDLFPVFFNRPFIKICFVGVVCTICFTVGLTMVTPGGMYIFQLFDYFTGSRIILLVAFFECIAIAYVYGAKRFSRNMEMMYGFRIPFIPEMCLYFLTPVFTMILFVISVKVYEELEYKRASIELPYKFPVWAVRVGWSMAACSVIMIPIIAIIEMCRTKGTFCERIKYLCKPRFREDIKYRLDFHTKMMQEPKPCNGERFVLNDLKQLPPGVKKETPKNIKKGNTQIKAPSYFPRGLKPSQYPHELVVEFDPDTSHNSSANNEANGDIANGLLAGQTMTSTM